MLGEFGLRGAHTSLPRTLRHPFAELNQPVFMSGRHRVCKFSQFSCEVVQLPAHGPIWHKAIPSAKSVRPLDGGYRSRTAPFLNPPPF